MSKRDVLLFITDIKESIEAIFEYIKDEDYDNFIEDRNKIKKGLLALFE